MIFKKENPNLNIQIENKLCKAYYNDGSSTMIMVIPEQTCHQVLNKILEKKKLTWYKCNIYFLDDNQVFFNSTIINHFLKFL